jgi:hypothetical protein
MRSAFFSSLAVLFAIMAVSHPAGAQAPLAAFAYASSGSCLNSPEGFNSKLEPVNSGVAWTMAFNAEGSVDASGNGTEVGQSVDTASFGVGPRMHAPAANAYQAEFSATVTANSDGSHTIAMGKLSGRFTNGPYSGETFMVAPGALFKQSPAETGVSVLTTIGPLVVQTFSLSKGTKFQRICTVRTVITSALR